jgi:hypothetical protein
MQDYTRGDVEFLAIELFHLDNGDSRSWWTWDGSPSKLEYRIKARIELEQPVEAVQIILEDEVVGTIEKPKKGRKKLTDEEQAFLDMQTKL